MTSSVVAARGAKLGVNTWAPQNGWAAEVPVAGRDDLTGKELSRYHDLGESLVLPRVLARDAPWFARHAARYGAASADQRKEIAARYVPNSGRGGARAMIERLLRAAAFLPLSFAATAARKPQAVLELTLFLEQERALGLGTVWADDESFDELDPQRLRDRRAMLEWGALLVARRGGRRCFECGHPIAASRGNTDYCGVHATVEEGLRKSHARAIREVLYAASGYRRVRRSRRRGRVAA